MFGISDIKIIKKISSDQVFWEIVCLVLAIMSAFFWIYNSILGYQVFVLISILFIFIFNDLKYIIPLIIYGLFINSGSNVDLEVITQFMVIGILVLCIVFIYFILSKPKFKFDKNSIPLLLMAIFTFIPFFWRVEVPTELNDTWILYFSGFSYYLGYIVFRNNKSNIMNIIVQTMTYIPLLLFIQVFYIQDIHFLETNKLLTWYDLGWGMCNEVSILLCISTPFIIYRIIKSKFNNFFIFLFFISLYTLYLTFSRGGYLFIGMMLLIYISYFCSKAKNKKIVYISLCSIILISMFLIIKFQIIQKIFLIANPESTNPFGDSNRFKLYAQSWNLFSSNFRNCLFGSGFISEYVIKNHSEQIWATKFIVYHSTIFQGMVMGGICMIVALLYHCYKKYIYLFKSKSTFAHIMIIGFFCVDLYGLIDNTYFMYYYMIPMVIILAGFDNCDGDIDLIY